MARLFDRIKMRRPKLSKFDLSHERKFSFNMGKLIPMFVQEVVPGDRFRVNTEVLMRLAPMLAPIMHRVNVTTHYFFVPNRLVWNEWEDFITGGRLGTSNPVAPYFVMGDAAITADKYTGLGYGSLGDFLGVKPLTAAPVNAAYSAMKVSALPFRAYQLIYDEYYRDQNVSPSIDISVVSGQVTGAELLKLLAMRTRAWEKDYFTSALPFAQRGGAVSLPIEMDANDITYKYPATVSDGSIGATAGNLTTDASAQVNAVFPAVGAQPAGIENIEDIVSTSVTIEALRMATRLQQWLENNARAGGRYVEQLLSHFGVISDDARLQRPEYLGGGKSPVVISEVLSTFQADAGTIPQGNMAGHGISAGGSNGFNRAFKEHGYVIGIVSVLPRTAYMDGALEKHLFRFDKYDYYFPEFAHLGEQPVLNKELYVDWPSAPDVDMEGTFGYQSRYCEYKYRQSSVHGEMRSNLDFWHMARQFGSSPLMEPAFFEADPTHRIFAVEDESIDKLYCQLYNGVSALRPMPYFSTPML